jgi:hypothetical protein
VRKVSRGFEYSLILLARGFLWGAELSFLSTGDIFRGDHQAKKVGLGRNTRISGSSFLSSFVHSFKKTHRVTVKITTRFDQN